MTHNVARHAKNPGQINSKAITVIRGDCTTVKMEILKRSVDNNGEINKNTKHPSIGRYACEAYRSDDEE